MDREGKKARKFVIRGLPGGMSIDVIVGAIERLKLDGVKVLNVERMIEKNGGNDFDKKKLFVLNAMIGGRASKIFEVKALNGYEVSVEKFRKLNHIVQCFKCQRFGHTAPKRL